MTGDDRPAHPASGLAEALAEFQAGNLERAEHLYRGILAEHPDDGLAMFLLAILLLSRIGTARLPEALDLVARFATTQAAEQETLANITAVIAETLHLDRLLNLMVDLAERDAALGPPQAVFASLMERLQGPMRRALAQRVIAADASGRALDPPQILLHELLGVIASKEEGFFFGDGLASLNKNRGFLDDAAFSAAFERNAATGEERGRAWRLHTLTWAAKQALTLDGDFVECGVFEGFMSATVAEYVDFAHSGRLFHLYDTFEGFSDKYSSPEDFGVSKGFFDLAQGIYTRPGLYEKVCKRFSAYPNIKVIRGVVPDVLRDGAPDRIAYCHIDLNSPAAEVGALDILFERVVPGGLIIFDDYGWLPFARQKAAEDAFAEAHGYSILELPTGQGLLVKR